MRNSLGAAMAIGAIALAAGCSSSSSYPQGLLAPTVSRASATPTPAPTNVAIANYAYKPAKFTVKVGVPVEWANRDPIGHTVTAYDSSWTSPVLFGHRRRWHHAFKKAGKYKYYCKVHPYMHGTIVVTN